MELGTKFKTATAGTVTGVRVYKGAANTGQHVGNLWSRSGQLLASVVFTNETASDWQEARFATPVTIAANTTYVISYHTNVGRYAVNTNYFATSGRDAAPLRAPANGEDGGNGVYRYGSTSAFPSSTWSSSNYWVDVVFQTGSTVQSTTAKTLSAPLTASSPAVSTLAAPSGGTTTNSSALTAPTAGAAAIEQPSARATASTDTAAATAEVKPDAPTLSAPVAEDVVATRPTFTTGAFHSPDPIAVHAETRWQVFQDDDSHCVYDVRSRFGLTRLALPDLVLEDDTSYFWRAQFIDQSGRASEWSDYGYFATEAGIGTPAGESPTDSNRPRPQRDPRRATAGIQGADRGRHPPANRCGRGRIRRHPHDRGGVLRTPRTA